jgi:hypothetical protein
MEFKQPIYCYLFRDLLLLMITGMNVSNKLALRGNSPVKKNIKLLVTLCLPVWFINGSNDYGIETNFDSDNNGLYDDQERKVLLDFLQQEYPDLEADYDSNNDGKVTVLEQTTGRLPLSLRIPESAHNSNQKITWALNLFPEWLMSAYFQEDVEIGEVVTHHSRGSLNRDATQQNDYLQPEKIAINNGIEFAENSGQYLSMPGQRDARWNYRWCIFTFRIDANSGDDNQTILLDINQGNRSNKSSPKIWYDKVNGISIQYIGLNKRGLDKRIMTTKKAIVADGKTWNVIVTGIRYGQMFASVNGLPLSTDVTQADHFSGQELGTNITSYIGDPSTGNMAWAYDTLAFGLTEPSEAMVRKMSGWAAHRLGFYNELASKHSYQINLPYDHPYKISRPAMDEEDFPYRYIHDGEKWTHWGEGINYSQVRINGGGERVPVNGFERVFYDDFRRNRVKPSSSGEADLWSAPGFNTAVGVDARLIAPNQTDNAYLYDSREEKQTLSLIKQGERWRGSAFYSVNDLGHGYTWSGPKIFRIRSMFPKIDQKDLPGGLFPAFWSYDPDFLFWRTANRIEVDWFEFDGQNGTWYNGLSSHYHYAAVKNIFAKKPTSYQSYKVYGGALTEEKSKIAGGLEFWDGDYHTWEFVINNDITFVNVTIKDEAGNDKWVEVARVPTAPTYLERLDLQLNYALKSDYGNPTSERESFTVDWIEVLQKTSEVMKLPKPFVNRPILIGEKMVGSTITCQANLQEITDIRYYWFANGYPLTYTASNTYEMTSAEAGKNIRCMVKAVGALNMPEAWTQAVNIAAY